MHRNIIPDGWTATSWARELERKATACEASHPMTAKAFRELAANIPPEPKLDEWGACAAVPILKGKRQ